MAGEHPHDHPSPADQAEFSTIIDAPPPPVPDLGEGDPPTAMAEHYGMTAVPAEGPSDEEGGELIDPDEAVADSEAAAGAGGSGA